MRSLPLLLSALLIAVSAEDAEERRGGSKEAVDAGQPVLPRVMVMPPVSLMLAVPHPSGRFLMLFPTTHLLPILPMQYHQPSQAQYHQPSTPEHPALFAARQQMLYPGPQQPSGHTPPYRPQAYTSKRNPLDGN